MTGHWAITAATRTVTCIVHPTKHKTNLSVACRFFVYSRKEWMTVLISCCQQFFKPSFHTLSWTTSGFNARSNQSEKTLRKSEKRSFALCAQRRFQLIARSTFAISPWYVWSSAAECVLRIHKIFWKKIWRHKPAIASGVMKRFCLLGIWMTRTWHIKLVTGHNSWGLGWTAVINVFNFDIPILWYPLYHT